MNLGGTYINFHVNFTALHLKKTPNPKSKKINAPFLVLLLGIIGL
jgi:hypothetical protein